MKTDAIISNEKLRGRLQLPCKSVAQKEEALDAAEADRHARKVMRKIGAAVRAARAAEAYAGRQADGVMRSQVNC